MSFWFNKRETGSPYDAADELFEAAVMLSREPDRVLDAERCLASAIDAYRALVPHTKGFEAKRRLAKALWREATFTAERHGRHHDALTPGREALDLGRAVLEAVEPSHAAFDAIVQEVSGAMNDVAQIYFGAGQPKERERQLLEAAEIARRSDGSGGRQALGTALHNIAQHRLFDLVSSARRHSGTPVELMAALALTEKAFEIRLRLCEEARAQPYYAWECANSALQLGQLLSKLERRVDASQVLQEGIQRLSTVHGWSVDSLRPQLETALRDTGEQPAARDRDLSWDEIMRSLSPSARVLLEVIGMLEAEDRRRLLVQPWFLDRWRTRSDGSVTASFDEALAELVARGVVRDRICEGGDHHYDIDYLIERHVRAHMSDADDFCLSRAHLFAQRFQADLDLPGANPVRSGIAAAVYARRAGKYQNSLDVLEHCVLGVACRSGEARYVLMHMQLSAEASEKRELIERVDRATEALANAHCVEGNHADALETLAYGVEFAMRRELGVLRVLRWLEHRLELLYRMGRYDDVLAELDRLLKVLDSTPANDRVEVMRVREAALHHGAGAAKALQRWQVSLELNRSIVGSLEARAASPAEIAAQRSYDYAGLLELGQVAEADALLRECEAVLQQSSDLEELAGVLGARGIVASRRGDSAQALQLKRRSLDLSYKANANLAALALAHVNYANELLRRHESTQRVALHWLAGGALHAICGNRAASTSQLNQIVEARRIAAFELPSTFEALMRELAEDGFSLERALQASVSAARAREVIAAVLSSLRR
jgi:tetratricopeptide (TPR) repeat protein